MTLGRWLLGMVALVLAGSALVAGLGHLRWSRLSAPLQAQLQAQSHAQSPTPLQAPRDAVAPVPAAAAASAATRFDPRELQGLPTVVQRYFRTVLPDGTPIVAAAELSQEGRFDMGEVSPQWKPFVAQQRVVTRRPGFVWDARIGIVPGVRVHVHDAYLAGEGLLHAAISGLFTVAEQRDAGELARGELMRYLAETPWYPTALLPSQGVRWEPIDERRARATLGDGALQVSLDFSFDAQGLVERVSAAGRGRREGGALVPRPWEGRWSDYQLHDGLLVPMAAEVAWLLPTAQGGRKVYWRGRVTELRLERAR